MPSLAALDRALSEATEAQAQLETARDALEFDPDRAGEDRGAAVRPARRWRASTASRCAELAPLAEKMAAQLAALDDGEAGLKKLAAAGEGRARGLCRRRPRRRPRRAARAPPGSTRRWRPSSAPLKLEKAKFVTELGAAGRSRTGPKPAPTACSSPSPPIPARRRRRSRKIASGGELSRFLLALKVCLAKVGDAATIVFDEVDSGIGGATAAAVGERLKRLAKDVQVLVVTHSPQVAADRRPPLADPQDHDAQRRQHRRRCRSTPRAAARRSPACCRAPRSPPRRAPPPTGCWRRRRERDRAFSSSPPLGERP